MFYSPPYVYLHCSSSMTAESISELELERFKINMGIPLQAENKLVFNLKKDNFRLDWQYSTAEKT